MDNTIEQILRKKAALIERYAKISFKEAGAIVDGGASASRKAACDRLRDEIDQQIKYYDNEIKLFQDKRGALWDAHSDLQEYLLAQEKSRNASLDDVYKKHSGILEKVYLRHIANTETVAVSTIEAGTLTFKDMLAAPFQFLGQLFVRSSGVSLIQNNIENRERVQVERVERELNHSDSGEELHEHQAHHRHANVPDTESDDEFSDENYSIPIA